MYPILSKTRQLGVTLLEMMIVIILGLVVTLAAGAIYRGVGSSFTHGAHKVVGSQEATFLSKVLSRRVRVASDFMVYDVSNRLVEADPGDGLALMDTDGNVTYRFELDSGNKMLADSTGARMVAISINNLQFSVDPVSPRTLRYVYQTLDEQGGRINIESAVTLRN